MSFALLAVVIAGALLLAPIVVFWLWMGVSLTLWTVWLRGLLALWSFPLAFVATFVTGALVLCFLMLAPSGLLSWTIFSLIVFWVLPIGVGIWMAKRYPLQRNSEQGR
jgi:hypothetical protein